LYWQKAKEVLDKEEVATYVLGEGQTISTKGLPPKELHPLRWHHPIWQGSWQHFPFKNIVPLGFGGIGSIILVKYEIPRDDILMFKHKYKTEDPVFVVNVDFELNYFIEANEENFLSLAENTVSRSTDYDEFADFFPYLESKLILNEELAPTEKELLEVKKEIEML